MSDITDITATKSETHRYWVERRVVYVVHHERLDPPEKPVNETDLARDFFRRQVYLRGDGWSKRGSEQSVFDTQEGAEQAARTRAAAPLR